MKKILTAALISVALIATTTTATAATTAPPIKKPSAPAKEGTKAHESSESKTTMAGEKVSAKKLNMKGVKTLTPTTKKKN